MTDLPDGWVWTDLGSLSGGFQAGRNLRAKGHPAVAGERGVLKISAVTWGEFDPSQNKALNKGDKPKPHETVRRGDLLISRANTSALVGAVVLVNDDHPNLMLPDKILRILYEPRAIDPCFLKYALRTPTARDHMEINATGTSDSMRNLSQPKLSATPVPLAPLPEQHRIVAKVEELLSKVNAARERLEKVPGILKRFRQSVLAAACSGRLTEDWRTGADDGKASDLINKLLAARRKEYARCDPHRRYTEPVNPDIADDLPLLPESWTWASPDQLSAGCPNALTIGPFGSNLKVSDYRDAGVPLVFVRHVRARCFDNTKFVSKQKAKELAACAVRPGDLVVTKMGEPPGDAAVYPRKCPEGIVTADCIKLTLSSVLPDVRFFVHAIHSEPTRRQVRRISMGVAQQKMSLKRFKTLALPVPPATEQREIVRRVGALLRLADLIEQRMAFGTSRTETLTQSILAKAFRGELVPTEVELARQEGREYEPASVLLERIKAEVAEQKAKTTKRRNKTRSRKRARG